MSGRTEGGASRQPISSHTLQLGGPQQTRSGYLTGSPLE